MITPRPRLSLRSTVPLSTLRLAIPGVTTHALNIVSRLVKRATLATAVIAGVAALGFTLCASPGVTFAQAPTSNGSSRADALTQALLSMSNQYRAAAPEERLGLESNLVSTAATRLEVLASLMETDPAAVLASALPTAVRASLPASVTAYLEQDAELEGTLEILHEDWPSESRYHYYLHSTTGRYSLHFADREPDDLLTGAKIRIQGVQIGYRLALADKGSSVQTVATAPVPNALGEQRTLVILVNFQDKSAEPYTLTDAQNVIFGTTSDFFLENSYRQTWLRGDVFGWYTIALSSTVCDSDTLAAQAKAAASAAGVDLAAYAHHLYAFPQNACGWWGLSSVGGSPSQSWVNGNFELGVTAHELGHGMGLWHSHSLYCGASAAIGSSCSSIEYGDIVDMMGASQSAHFNAFQKERLGWLKSGISPTITTVMSDGTYTLETYEPVGSNAKALKVLKSTDPTTGKRTWYYIESRQAIGFDSFLAQDSNNVVNGVLVHIGTEGNGNSSSLLDMTPATPVYYWWYDPALVVSQSFNDPQAGVTLMPQWVNGTGAAVTVRFELGVTVSTDQPSYSRNQTVTITATVSSVGSPVGKATVNFTITKPGGALVKATVTTATNGIAVYKLRLAKQDPVGTYQVGANATKNGAFGSATTTFTVK